MENIENQITERDVSVKVDKRAVQDLLRLLRHGTIPFVSEILELLKEVLPRIEASRSTEQELAAIQQVVQKAFGRQSPRYEATMCALLPCVQELDHYTEKVAVVEAAMAEVRPLADMVRRLTEMELRVKVAWRSLDARSRAVLKVYNTLTCVDGASLTSYMKSLDAEGDPAVLKDDPALKQVVEAYYLAQAYLEATEDR